MSNVGVLQGEATEKSIKEGRQVNSLSDTISRTSCMNSQIEYSQK